MLKIPLLIWSIIILMLFSTLIPILQICFTREEWLWLLALKNFSPDIPYWLMLVNFLTSFFLHGDLMHFFFNGVGLITIGSLVYPFLKAWRMTLFLLSTKLAGDIVFFALHWQESYLVMGASGALFGLLGALPYVLYNARKPKEASTLLGKSLFFIRYIGLMMFLNLAFAWIYEWGSQEGTQIGWENHMGGFFCGLALFPLLSQKRYQIPERIENVSPNPKDK